MMLNAYEAITLVMSANGGAIEGRTTVQKLVYLCATQIESIDISSYVHYFYGPFSRDVASDLESMSELAYVTETSPMPFERYKYEFTPRGKKLALKVSSQYKEELEKIRHIIGICKNFCSLKPQPLSFAAKAYYILANTEKERAYTKDDVREIAKKFDWDINQKDMNTGVDLLEKLNLVQVKRIQT